MWSYPQQVQQAVHEHETALVRGAVAKAGRLADDHLGRQDDVAQLHDLIHGDILVKRRVALEGQDVGGAVDAAPFAVELVHLVLIDIGERDLDLARNALGREDVRRYGTHLVLLDERGQLGVVTDEHGHGAPPFRPWRGRSPSCAPASRPASNSS